MTFGDLLSLSVVAMLAHRVRYGLSALAIAIGVGAVVAWSSRGGGPRRCIQVLASCCGTSVCGGVSGGLPDPRTQDISSYSPPEGEARCSLHPGQGEQPNRHVGLLGLQRQSLQELRDGVQAGLEGLYFRLDLRVQLGQGLACR